MKDIQRIKHHLQNERAYSHNARIAIRYWLLGKGIISIDDDVDFKANECGVASGTFEDFVKWYDAMVLVSSFDAASKCKRIEPGDLVKVLSLSDPRDEYVEAVLDSDGSPIYCLSDGSWVCGEGSVVKYKIQGNERWLIVDILNEVY